MLVNICRKESFSFHSKELRLWRVFFCIVEKQKRILAQPLYFSSEDGAIALEKLLGGELNERLPASWEAQASGPVQEGSRAAQIMTEVKTKGQQLKGQIDSAASRTFREMFSLVSEFFRHVTPELFSKLRSFNCKDQRIIRRERPNHFSR